VLPPAAAKTAAISAVFPRDSDAFPATRRVPSRATHDFAIIRFLDTREELTVDEPARRAEQDFSDL
jgi:hypothetical protein